MQLVGAGSLFHRVTVTVDNTAPYLLPVSSLVLFYPAQNRSSDRGFCLVTGPLLVYFLTHRDHYQGYINSGCDL